MTEGNLTLHLVLPMIDGPDVHVQLSRRMSTTDYDQMLALLNVMRRAIVCEPTTDSQASKPEDG